MSLNNLNKCTPNNYKNDWKASSPLDAPLYQEVDVDLAKQLYYMSLRELFQPTED